MDYYKQLLIELSDADEKVFENYGEILWVGLTFDGKEISYRGYDRIPVLNKKGCGFSEFHKGYYSNVNALIFPMATGKCRIDRVVLYSNYIGDATIGEGQLVMNKVIDKEDFLRIDAHNLKIKI